MTDWLETMCAPLQPLTEQFRMESWVVAISFVSNHFLKLGVNFLRAIIYLLRVIMITNFTKGAFERTYLQFI